MSEMSDLRKERPGRGLWRSVYASIWDHEDFRALSPNARLALCGLRLGPSTTIASIFMYYPAVVQAQTGLSPRALAAALKELERTPNAERPWIVRDASVLWIRNGLRFDTSLSLKNDNHIQALRRTVAALPQRSAVVQQFLAYYPEVGPLDDGMGVSHGVSHTPSQGGSRSSSSSSSSSSSRNRNRNRITKPRTTKTAGDASPAPPLAIADSESKHPDNGTSLAALQSERIRDGIRAKHPDWGELQVNRAAVPELVKIADGNR
jgi:hypothetical protein